MAEFDDHAQSEAFKWEEAYTEGLNIRGILQEDEGGSVEDAIRRLIMEEKRQRRRVDRPPNIRLGIMRYIYVSIDLSTPMLSKEFYPSRLRVALGSLRKFVDKFFELNPLSQMGVIIVHDKRAERICGFTSSVQMLKETLSNIGEASCSGEFSIQSALQLALHSFQNLPIHSSKECVMLVASLSTVDATNLQYTYEQLKMRSVRCSVVSFSAEVFAFKKLCTTTSGKYNVALDEEHLGLLLDEHVQPPPAQRKQGHQDSIIRMGFPQRRRVLYPSFCACHELYGETPLLSAGGNNMTAADSAAANPEGIARAYFCPQCGAKYCQTPVECRICGLLLLTAPQLARAHQHLEPLPAFLECTPAEGSACFACEEPLQAPKNAYKCKKCDTEFCIDCDILLHESLQVCPCCAGEEHLDVHGVNVQKDII